MIRISDAWTLATTKLRTRKTRTIVTAVLASLLFAGLVFAFTVVKGGLDSYSRYSKNGLSQRYITNASSYGMGVGSDFTSSEAVVKAKERNKQIIAEKKADAKRLGLEYDAGSEAPVTLSDGQGGSGEYLNTQNFAVQQIMSEAVATQKTTEDKIRELASTYNPKQFYTPKSFGDTENLSLMKSGKETFEVSTQQDFLYTPDPLKTLSYMPRTVVNPFLLEGADLSVAKEANSSIPVIVTYADAEKALGLTTLPKTASNEERLARINEVKQKAPSVTISVCYRNGTSSQLIEQTKLQIAETEKRKNDATYQKPSQIYALPDSSSCGPAIVTKDSRTANEKLYAAKQKEFDLKYGIEFEPVERKLTFRIVGLSADIPDYGSMSGVENLALMVGGTSLVGQWVVPSELVDVSLRENYIPQRSGNDSMAMYHTNIGVLTEFSSAADAKKFVTEQSCNGMDCSTKPMIMYFGSNSVLMDDIMQSASQILQIVGLVISLVAAVLMMGMVGRVITDSRRETAVFRAIGAKRNDIRLMYTLYVVAFSLIIAVSALVIGFGLAQLYSMSVTDSLTTSAKLMFIESRETAPFSLVSVWPQAIALTVGVIVLSGFVSMLLPLSRNLARSPLKDMRDE